uniref:Uncharacterized protein n=1 Tax=Oryza rufipogon TaxID=4529 RepID=A0A0E0QUM4_ORYRU
MAGSWSWVFSWKPDEMCYEECPDNFLGCISSKQAQDILHDLCITRQCDPSIGCEAKLLLRHPEELCKDRRGEERQRDLKPPPIGSVHDAMALHCHRTAAFIGCFGCRPCDPLPPEGCYSLPLLCHLSEPLGTDHGLRLAGAIIELGWSYWTTLINKT